ncbi:MAG: cytochrome c [Gammaproteobacteria bacterium]|nr:cytochrome c [Gammaproteobacteria bacterium]
MKFRLFLLLMLIVSTTAQARDMESREGCACEDYQRDSMRYREREDSRCDRERYRERGRRDSRCESERYRQRGRGEGLCNSERYRRGEGYRGPRMGGRGHGGHSHSRWNIPVQEARRLNPIEVSPQSLVRGEALYLENCSRCHGEDGFGDGPQARELRVLPPRLHHATRHYTDGELSYIIRKGRDPMPAWEDKLSENELWDLINYLRFQIGSHRGPRYNRDARFNRGSRAGDCPDRYRNCEETTERYYDYSKATQDAYENQGAMQHDDQRGKDTESHHEEKHDEHEDD